MSMTTVVAERVLAEARKLIGTPYAELDCSHFVCTAYRKAGLEYAYAPTATFGSARGGSAGPFKPVAPTDLRPADVLVFRGHMGLWDPEGCGLMGSNDECKKLKDHAPFLSSRSGGNRGPDFGLPRWWGNFQAFRWECFNPELERTLDEYDTASDGMKAPMVTRLEPRQRLFRFGSSRKLSNGATIKAEEWANGGWWFSESDYSKILASFGAGKLPLGTVARMAGAVQPSWSLMDVVVEAELIQDIFVYTGQGKKQHRDKLPNGWYFTSSGWPEVRQIYIPNMRNGARSSLKVLRQEVIQSNTFGY